MITLPYGAIDCSLMVYLPKTGMKEILKLKIPFPRKHYFDGEHYWEIGKRGFPLGRIREILSKYFTIEKEFCPGENMYHWFFILRVR